jgi:2-carboxy-D-arabinitol-1-phosphatase
MPAGAGRQGLGRASTASIRCSSVREVESSPSPHPGASLPSLREAKRVVLVRHGQSTWNAEGRIQGSSDISVLTAKGESQAETSRQMLLSDSFDACFTSPLARSRRTAEIIWEGRSDELITDSDLREIDLYSFQVRIRHAY